VLDVDVLGTSAEVLVVAAEVEVFGSTAEVEVFGAATEVLAPAPCAIPFPAQW